MKKLIYSLALLFTLTSAVYADFPRSGFQNNNTDQRNGFTKNYHVPRRVNHYNSNGILIRYSMIYSDGTVQEYDAMGICIGSSR
ncbi:hypothetical protein LCGC14_2104390 [marine sediment metagenome]|uniref:Uncharacterized protein n=1 Tax=marine sediment metagenome TaxID=412755 RepID=A0A0F9E952_9ZZZZ|nr:hypothetical protein [Candidatus Anoxychlamydiales bacterium]